MLLTEAQLERSRIAGAIHSRWLRKRTDSAARRARSAGRHPVPARRRLTEFADPPCAQIARLQLASPDSVAPRWNVARSPSVFTLILHFRRTMRFNGIG
jgi:hypothetical protein